MNKACRRQSSAEWAARAVTDILDENKVWSTGWRQLRAHNDGAFRDAVEEAAALHAHNELFAKHIEPEPAPEDPVEWAMAAASSGVCTSHDQPGAVHRSAPRVRRRTTMSLVKNSQPSYHIVSLCFHTCPLSRVWCLPVVSRVRCLRSVGPAQDSQLFFFLKCFYVF